MDEIRIIILQDLKNVTVEDWIHLCQKGGSSKVSEILQKLLHMMTPPTIATVMGETLNEICGVIKGRSITADEEGSDMITLVQNFGVIALFKKFEAIPESSVCSTLLIKYLVKHAGRAPLPDEMTVEPPQAESPSQVENIFYETIQWLEEIYGKALVATTQKAILSVSLLLMIFNCMTMISSDDDDTFPSSSIHDLLHHPSFSDEYTVFQIGWISRWNDELRKNTFHPKTIVPSLTS